MDSEVARELPGIIRVYKNGTVERLREIDFVPPSLSDTNVSSKDITILPEHNVSARIYLPKLTNPTQKFPILLYFHGGAFCVSSPFTTKYHNYITKLVSEANVVAVSVDYRKAPENPIPDAYEDSWTSLQWVVSHSNRDGSEPWLNQHGDFDKIFLCGDSAGANIAHNLALAAGNFELGLPLGLLGVALVHPYFWGSDPIGSEALDMDRKVMVDNLWPFICPSNPDNNDGRLNPFVEGGPNLAELGCRRVLVCVAEKDVLKDRGWLYYETLGRSGWMGVVEIHETEGEDHAFHLNHLDNPKANDLIQRLAAFLNRDFPPMF